MSSFRDLRKRDVVKKSPAPCNGKSRGLLPLPTATPISARMH